MIYGGYVHSNRMTSYMASTLSIATFDVKRTHIQIYAYTSVAMMMKIKCKYAL